MTGAGRGRDAGRGPAAHAGGTRPDPTWPALPGARDASVRPGWSWGSRCSGSQLGLPALLLPEGAGIGGGDAELMRVGGPARARCLLTVSSTVQAAACSLGSLPGCSLPLCVCCHQPGARVGSAGPASPRPPQHPAAQPGERRPPRARSAWFAAAKSPPAAAPTAPCPRSTDIASCRGALSPLSPPDFLVPAPSPGTGLRAPSPRAPRGHRWHWRRLRLWRGRAAARTAHVGTACTTRREASKTCSTPVLGLSPTALPASSPSSAQILSKEE